MTYDDAFLQAILENPDDDTPRLIYADWLEERGDPRGEFIRIQCHLATMSADDERRSRLEQHERELLAHHQDRWLGELRPLLSGWMFRRGFLDSITVPAATYMQREAIPRPATVRSILVDLDGFEPPRSVLEFVPESVARENVVFPLGFRGRTLILAEREPLDPDILARMQFIFNRSVEQIAANSEQVIEAINRLYGTFENLTTVSGLTEFVDSETDYEMNEVDDDSPIARFLSFIILEAQAGRADQVRIQPQTECIQVLYRIDRKWVERDSPPKRLLNRIVSRIRSLADHTLIDEGEAETGHIRRISQGISLDLAVHLQPTAQGPSVTLTFLPNRANEPEA